MRLNNANKAGAINFFTSVVLMSAVASLAFFVLDRFKFHIFGHADWLFLVIPILILLVFYLRGRQFFAYDSDGEALNFKNRHLYPFLAKPSNDEFPKYKVKSFEVVDAVIFRKLYVRISSKKNQQTTLKYDISHLTRKEMADLKISLNKVVKTNKEKDGN